MFNRDFLDIEEIKPDLYFISTKYCYYYYQSECPPRRYGYLDIRNKDPIVEPLK